MPIFISFVKYTQQGITHIKDSPKRLDQARKLFAEYGVELQEFYLTMGRYDIVTVMEAADEEAVAKAILALTSGGNVASETVRAFAEEEFRRLVGALL